MNEPLPEPEPLVPDSDLQSPATSIPPDEGKGGPEEGIALCLSGGGYRAMLFHAGTLWRLNEAGLLSKLDRISSVSGGSITSGVLALAWNKLAFDANGVSPQTVFVKEVIGPIMALASRTIDESSIIMGGLSPFTSITDHVIASYKKYLFGEATLQDLPDTPRFIFNATNVQSKALWRFSKPYMRDWRVGEIKKPTIPLAVAVAASSAFPPFLSPVILDLEPEDFTPGQGTLTAEGFRTRVVLTDGGVYDNLGLETAWKRYKTILVSDAGGDTGFEEDTKGDWLRHTFRVVGLIDNQVRSLRLRQVVGSLKSGERNGAFWSTRTDIKAYKAPGALDCPVEQTQLLATTPTRLKRVPTELQQRLINWGYAACDASLRGPGAASGAVLGGIALPAGFPYPAVKVGTP